MTLQDRYLTYISSVRRYSVLTQGNYRRVLEEFTAFAARERGGDGLSDAEFLEDFSPAGIRRYEIYLLDEKKESARTVNMHLSVLSGCCRYLMKEGLLAANPVKAVSRPKMEKRLPEFYRGDSMKEYFDSTAFLIDDYEAFSDAKYFRMRLNRLIINILYCTGIRRSELISLDVGSIDFSRRVLRVHGKGGKIREIPLLDSLCKEILLYLNAVETMAGCARPVHEPLLVTEKFRRIYPVFVDRVVKGELGGVKSITGRKSPHVLRHTLATELLDDGADLNSIKEMLGHSSLAATQVYTHNSIAKLKKVYNNAHPRAKNGEKHGD